MNTCKQCNRSTIRTVRDDEVIFRCYCGEEQVGTLNDLRISGKIMHTGETAEKYEKLILHAPFDPTTQQVKKDCPGCRRDYLSQLRIGAEEFIIYACKCGYNSGLKPETV